MGLIEARGDPISGSRFFRDFCGLCKTPMRVCGRDLIRENYCEDCGRLAGLRPQFIYVQSKPFVWDEFRDGVDY